MGTSLSHRSIQPVIQSLNQCPVTGLPIRHDPRWVIVSKDQKSYRAEFSVIGQNFIHAHIIGYTSLDISKQYLDTFDAICEEIGSPVVLMEDYSSHTGTSGDARNYYVKHQRRNRHVAASVFFGVSPFFKAVIRVGLLFARVPYFVEIKPDYPTAVKSAMTFQKRTTPELFPVPDVSLKDGDTTIAWSAGDGAFSVTFSLLPGDIIFSKSSGTLRTKNDLDEYIAIYTRVLETWIIPGSTYIRLLDWTNFKYASGVVRSRYAAALTDLQKKYPCQLAVIYGLSPLTRAIYTITKLFFPSIPIKTAINFSEGIAKIHSFESSSDPLPLLKTTKGELPFSRAEFDSKVHDLIDYIGSINWEGRGIDAEAQKLDEKGPFKPVYEALLVLKQDYDEIAREKQAAEIQQRELEEKLRHSEKIHAIGLLAGGVAHDFNNQLASIMGFTELMKLKASNSAQVLMYADTILQTSKRCADLTSKLLAFARKGKYLPVEIDLHSLVNEVVAMLKHSIDKKVILQKDLAALQSTVTGDADLLQNALLNIAVNARDAMPQGGTLRFSSRTMTLSEQDCENPSFDLKPGDYLQLCVTDTGCGMSEEVQKHLFEPFFTTKEKGKGTGMGLASVYGTVKKHQGAIFVSSEPGKGTTIELLIPTPGLTPRKSCDVIKKAIPAEVTFVIRPQRILIVEDDPAINRLFSEILSEQGHPVMATNNGKEAIEVYSSRWQAIDLIILDLIMPVMSGPEAFYELRKINPDAKIIIASGYSIDGDAEKLIAAGAKGFLEKPFSVADLSKSIEQAMA